VGGSQQRSGERQAGELEGQVVRLKRRGHCELVGLEPQGLSSIKSQLTPMLNVAFLS
jgi:hypothetical protein